MSGINWIKSFDFFFLMRPMLFFPGWNTLLAGYLVARNDVQLFDQIRNSIYQYYFWKSDVLLAMLAFMAAMGGSFILNQLKDVKSDRKNKKLFLLGENHVSYHLAWIESIFLLLGSLIIGWLVNFRIALIMAFFIILTGYLYNFRPVEFKEKPIGGLLANMLMGCFAFAIGWLVVQKVDIHLIIGSLPYFFLNSSLYLLTTIPDAAGDRISKKITFCVRFGERLTIRLSLLLFLLSLVMAMIINDQLLLIIDLLALSWMISLARSLTQENAIKGIKMTILFFSLIICLKFPLYFLLMIGMFYLTRYYYRSRFNYDYPNFRGE
jgi:1,4-dihydroxy-2-naphthoate octaprenyltransferase